LSPAIGACVKMPTPPDGTDRDASRPSGAALGRLLRLSHSRVLLWAKEPGSDVPFEVSKVVQGPLQSACPTAPRCPGEAVAAPTHGSLYLDPSAAPRGDCAYAFSTRGECLKTRNQLALEAALFRPGEVTLTRRLLEALGFQVSEEMVETTTLEPRILNAHGAIGSKSQVRSMRTPTAGQIVLVRRLPMAGGAKKSASGRNAATKAAVMKAACAVRPGRGSP
jgi:hypothetical protein